MSQDIFPMPCFMFLRQPRSPVSSAFLTIPIFPFCILYLLVSAFLWSIIKLRPKNGYLHGASSVRAHTMYVHKHRAQNIIAAVVVYSQTCSKRTASRYKLIFPVTSHDSKD